MGHNVSFDRARVESEYSLAGTRTRWMDTMSLHVAVNGISSHQRPAWNKWKKKRETEKVQRVEAVEAIVDLIAQAKEEEEQARERGDMETVEKLARARIDMEDSLQVPYQSELDWDGNENENHDDDDDGNRTWESLTSANSLVDVARLHCNIELEQDKASVLSKLVRITRAELMPHLFPLESDSNPDPNPNPNLDLETDSDPTSPTTDSDHLSLADLLTYCATDVHTAHKVYSTILPSFLSRCPHPVSFSGVLTMGSSFLTVNSAWERYIESAERVYRGMEEGVKRRLIELATTAKEMTTTGGWEKDPWLAQLDWTLKKAGRSRGVVSDTFFVAFFLLKLC